MDHFVGEKKADLDRDGQGEARLNSWFRPAAADETAVTSLLRASEAVTVVQKRELLKEALGMNSEEANLALKKAGVDKTGIRPVVGGALIFCSFCLHALFIGLFIWPIPIPDHGPDPGLRTQTSADLPEEMLC